MLDPRHEKRISLVQDVFAKSFYEDQKHDNSKAEAVWKAKDELDTIISKHAPRYPIEKISSVDLSILRCCIYELLYNKDVPVKVVMNEAVTMAKELSGERSYAFVNAILGAFYNDQLKEKK